MVSSTAWAFVLHQENFIILIHSVNTDLMSSEVMGAQVHKCWRQEQRFVLFIPKSLTFCDQCSHLHRMVTTMTKMLYFISLDITMCRCHYFDDCTQIRYFSTMCVFSVPLGVAGVTP